MQAPLPPPLPPPCIMETMDKDPEGPPEACPILASNPNFICITAKSPKSSAQFLLPELSTIQQFKEELAKHFSCDTSQLVLVYFGRILKDKDTLRQCGITDGMTVHLVIRTLKRDLEDPPQSPYVPGTMPPALTPSGGSLPSPAFGSSLRGSWGSPEAAPSSSEWQLVPTSEMIVEKVWQVILANPEIQQLAQQVPAIRHILNNMDIMRVILDKMREIVDLAKNPEMFQDLKAPDQALISLHGSIPGGDNPLRQLNSELPEPGLNAIQELFASTLGRSQGSQLESLEHVGSLPLCHSSHSTHSTCSEESTAFSNLAPPPGQSSSMPNLPPTSGAGAFGLGSLPPPDASEIPKLIVNLCNAYTKRMMYSLMQSALRAAEGPPVAQQEQAQQQVLHFSQQMQSPEMVAAMSNPKAIQAWVQMEQGLQALMAEAPVLVPWFMLRLRGYSTGVSPWVNGYPCPGSAASE
ncbi:ubiquilin-1-like [Podarcis raffonei]|uniref:ubiquilin-1-like n=1 Tax=Podarcis raffonei TaxID=65483 RepID=UPI0023290CB9|nr:ubiquilin-1-like [Podarcis raffonei]